MRASFVGVASLMTLLLAGCGNSGDAPAKVQPDCGDHSPGDTHGPPKVTNLVDQIVNSAAPGKPTSLKLKYVAGAGVCVDGTTGDIHLYGGKTQGARLSLSFASDLTGQAIWPTDPTQALQIAETADGALQSPPLNSWNPAPAMSGDAKTFIFTVPYEKGHNYFYVLHYMDSTGTLQTVEPKIFNH